MPFYEVSCRGDVNVQDTFLTLARLIRDLRQRRVSNLSLKTMNNKWLCSSEAFHLRAFILLQRHC